MICCPELAKTGPESSKESEMITSIWSLLSSPKVVIRKRMWWWWWWWEGVTMKFLLHTMWITFFLDLHVVFCTTEFCLYGKLLRKFSFLFLLLQHLQIISYKKAVCSVLSGLYAVPSDWSPILLLRFL